MKQLILKLDSDVIAYLESHFDNEIVIKHYRQWKKECEQHKCDGKNYFGKKEEWYMGNSTEDFCDDTPKKTLKPTDTTNQTSRNVYFVQQRTWIVTKIIEDKQNISKQQPMSNQVEEIFSNKIQRTLILLVTKRNAILIQTTPNIQ